MRSVSAAACICACCMAFWVGARARDHADVGSSGLGSATANSVLSTWVASRDDQVRTDQVNVPALDYYSQMVSLLKKYYVEPIKDDDKLAAGAVRGMVASLGDPQSLFMEPADFHAYIEREEGQYEGIGVSVVLDLGGKKGKSSQEGIQPPPADAEEAVATLSRFPRVVVVAVTPGGPADKAGVKVGDTVSDIDGHWVVDETLIDKFKEANKQFVANKMTFSQIEPLRKELRQKTERALLPVRALNRIMTGTSGTTTIIWNRAGSARTTKITKGLSYMPKFAVQGPKIVLPMTSAGVSGLKQAMVGKSVLTLDLRDDANGSFPAMLSCLQLLGPTGHYGEIVSQRADEATPLAVQAGNLHPLKLTLLVSGQTRGPAEILALALSGAGKAKLVGQEMGGDRSVRQDVELPNGSGYDLIIGTYRSGGVIKHGKRGQIALLDRASGPAVGQPLTPVAEAGGSSSMLGKENTATVGGAK